MLEGLFELASGWLSARRARQVEAERADTELFAAMQGIDIKGPWPDGAVEAARLQAGAVEAGRITSAAFELLSRPVAVPHSIQDWHRGDRFFSATSQREALAVAVGRCSSHRGGYGRQLRGGMQISRSGGSAVPYVEWDSSWPRAWVNDGDPVDRAETWAAAVDAESPEVVEENRRRAGMRDLSPTRS